MKNIFINESKILSRLKSEHSLSYFIAVDEVGRGAGAGPVVVCASVWKVSVHLKPVKSTWLNLIADSKELTPEQRVECFSLICKDYHLSMDDFLIHLTESYHTSSVICSNLIKPTKILEFSQTDFKKMKIESVEKKYFDCVSFALGVASNREIDDMNIWNAIQIATNRALFKIQEKMKSRECANFLEHAALLFDGKLPIKMCENFFKLPQVTIIAGDALLKTIGFSSVIAKVVRDQYMINLKSEFPHIGFEEHKGYLTQKHRAHLKLFGHTRLHRQSFLNLD